MGTENREDVIQETAENLNTVQEVLSPEVFNTSATTQNLRIATDIEESPFQDLYDNEVTIGGYLSDVENLDDTVPLVDPPKTILVVRRGQVLSILMQAFSDPAIMDKEISIRMRLPNGQIEEGVGPGVFRDCLSEFWNEFYSRCALGTDVKVPFLRHEFQRNEWQAVARILAKGWDAVKYFPICLSLPFLEEAVYGTTYSSVKDSFMHYVAKHERDVFEDAMRNFSSTDHESLLDVLDSNDCHQMPTEENLPALLDQLGHKALIQTPMFVIESWRPILKDLANTLPPEKLAKIIQEQKPTPKRVKEILVFPEMMTAQQSCVSRFLKKYIMELDHTTLKNFLRFCTGADLLNGNRITVNFIETSDFQCRPQAHTCGCYLMLPLNYQNYPDLRSDFNAVLNSSVWVMDIV
ncbi:uncharacterized protein [Misgurnus anguillicaudatus]|uniref:uncharacterized protein n=1 Tax=Misgurnus anguillicaudatus TaxID=75329 RepID=UPI003CCF6399